jgi:preprotein translocase subunit SecA
MEYIKQHINSEAYAQRDPAVEYKKKGVVMFNQMVQNAKRDIVFQFMRCKVNVGPPVPPPPTKNA